MSLFLTELDQAIRAIVFADEKHKADGSFDRTKVRACGRGDELGDVDVGETHAGTVHPSTVMMIIAYITSLGRKFEFCTADVDGAFLIPDMEPGEAPIYVRFNAEFSSIIFDVEPAMAKYATREGELYVKLGKYLYGLPQSARVWQKHLTKVQVENMGFKTLIADQCAFIKGEGDDRIFITIHVDELGIGGTSKNVDKVLDDLKEHYKLKVQRGEHISYLGLSINVQPDGSRTIDKEGYRKEIAMEYSAEINKCERKPQTPSSPWILNKPPKGDKTVCGKRYASAVMKIMWLARLTGFHLLWTVTFLSSFCQDPTEHHYRALCQLLRFISEEPLYALRFSTLPNPNSTSWQTRHTANTTRLGGGTMESLFYSLADTYALDHRKSRW
jgi:hypothetical protein